MRKASHSFFKMGCSSTRIFINLIYGFKVHSSSQLGREVQCKGECGAGLGISMLYSSCVFLCTVLGKICSSLVMYILCSYLCYDMVKKEHKITAK